MPLLFTVKGNAKKQIITLYVTSPNYYWSQITYYQGADFLYIVTY